MTCRRLVLFLAMASPKQLHDDISKGKFKPVYYFYGQEDFRRSEAEKFVADHFLPDLQRSINYHKIDSRKTSAGELMASLANLPMLGEKEVFIIGSFETYKAKEMGQILQLIKNPDPNRVVVLSTPSAKTPKKDSTLYKTVTSIAEPVEFRFMTVEETQSIIMTRLAKHKLAIDRAALELLTGLVDGNRGGLESELNKLIDYKAEGGSITVEDISQICAGYELFNIFELGDIIVEGKIQKIMRMVNSLIGAGTSIDMLVALLQQHFLSLYLVKNGKSPVGNRGFLIPKFRQQARAYSNLQLEGIIKSLAEANTELRHQRLPEELVLETLALELSNKK